MTIRAGTATITDTALTRTFCLRLIIAACARATTLALPRAALAITIFTAAALGFLAGGAFAHTSQWCLAI